MRLLDDTRTVTHQVLSGLKISAFGVGTVIMISIFLSFIPVHRIEAFYWHLRHGVFINVGVYHIPVPKHWYVADHSSNDVMMVDLDTGDGILVRTSSARPTLAAWWAMTNRPASDGDMKIVGRRELQVGGETMICAERDLVAKSIHMYPIECRSEDGLEVTFFAPRGHDETFYSLLQQVQKL